MSPAAWVRITSSSPSQAFRYYPRLYQSEGVTKEEKMIGKPSNFLTVLALAITFFANISHAAQDFDFRKTRWGMSKEEVIQSEGKKPINEVATQIYYSDFILDRKVLVLYTIINNKLRVGGYILEDEHTDKNIYIDDYNDFKEVLIDKYGSPMSDEVIWHNSLYINDTQRWGLAVSMGHLEYQCRWETERNVLILGLHGDNNEVSLHIAYIGKLPPEPRIEDYKKEEKPERPQ